MYRQLHIPGCALVQLRQPAIQRPGASHGRGRAGTAARIVADKGRAGRKRVADANVHPEIRSLARHRDGVGQVASLEPRGRRGTQGQRRSSMITSLEIKMSRDDPSCTLPAVGCTLSWSMACDIHVERRIDSNFGLPQQSCSLSPSRNMLNSTGSNSGMATGSKQNTDRGPRRAAVDSEWETSTESQENLYIPKHTHGDIDRGQGPWMIFVAAAAQVS